MAAREKQSKPLSEERRGKSGEYKTTSVAFDNRLFGHFVDLDKDIGWKFNAVLTQVRFARVAGGWQIMLKARRGEEQRVTFLNTRTFEQAVCAVAELGASETLSWSRDKYPV